MMDCLEELTDFLGDDQRSDIKRKACTTVVQLSGTTEGVDVVHKNIKLVEAVVSLISGQDDAISKDAMRILVNISAEKGGCDTLLNTDSISIVEKIVECIWTSLDNDDCQCTDFACGVLANLTRDPLSCERVLSRISNTEKKLDGLVFILFQPEHNKKGAELHNLEMFITNITQVAEGRRQLMKKDRCMFLRLLPFPESGERRKSIIAAIHNCCFEKEYHEWLMSDEVDLASHLCLPLADSNVYTDEENNSLPLDLQYLPEDKCPEEDIEIRTLLLESLMQLCVTECGRKRLRDLNIYLILREHHKWEKESKCFDLNEDIVNLLLKTEEEIGHDDLSSLDIPADMRQKFEDFDNNPKPEEVDENAKPEEVDENAKPEEVDENAKPEDFDENPKPDT